MSKLQVKFLIFLGGAALLIPLAFVGFSLLSNFITEFNRGAVPASIFHGDSLYIPTPDQAVWLPDPADYHAMQPSATEREEVIGTYWEAWEALARACMTGNGAALATYWAGGAFQQVKPITNCAKNTTMTHQSHRLQLQFFSDDGTVVAFTDNDFQTSYSTSGVTDILQNDAVITMTLDTGVWRVRQITISAHG